jgi:hypothetical protein
VILDQVYNHGVLLVDMCRHPISEHIYVKYQNSWGTLWGYSGFGYILVSNGTEVFDNCNVFDVLYSASIYDLHIAGTIIMVDTNTVAKLEYITKMLTIVVPVTVGLIMTGIVAMTSLFLLRKRKRNSDVESLELTSHPTLPSTESDS